MKLKKMFIILVVSFLLTGCASVKYNLNIEKDLEVQEEVYISATSEYFNNFYKNLPITIVKEFYNSDEIMKPLKDNNYQYELLEEKVTYPTVFVQKKYNSLDEYANNTIFKNQSFEEIFVTTNGSSVTLEMKGFLPYLEDEDNARYSISNVNINIKLPYIVSKHNANKYDAKNNTYTWNINKDTTDKKIELSFDKNKRYIYNIYMYISMFILFLIIVIIIIIILKMRKKNKINNRFSEWEES